MRRRKLVPGLFLFSFTLIAVLIALAALGGACSSNGDCLCSYGAPYCVGGSCVPCCSGCYYSGTGSCLTASGSACKCASVPPDCKSSATVSSTSTIPTSQCTSSSQCPCSNSWCLNGMCQPCPTNCYLNSAGGGCVSYSTGQACPGPAQAPGCIGATTSTVATTTVQPQCTSSAQCPCSNSWCLGGNCQPCPMGYYWSGGGGGCFSYSSGQPYAGSSTASGCISTTTTVVSTTTAAPQCSSNSNCPCNYGAPYCVGGSCVPCCKGCYYTGAGSCVTASGSACACSSKPSDCEIISTTSIPTTTIAPACTSSAQCPCSNSWCLGGNCQPCNVGCYWNGAGGGCVSYSTGQACPGPAIAAGCISSTTTVPTTTTVAPICTSNGGCSCNYGTPYCVGGNCAPCCKGCYYTGTGSCVTASGSACTCASVPPDCNSAGSTSATQSTAPAQGSSTSGSVSQGNPVAVTVLSAGAKVTVTSTSSISQAATVSASDATATSPDAPSGLSKVSAVFVSVSSSTPTQTYVQLQYPSSAASGKVAPYALSNGQWTMIPQFATDPVSHTVSFAAGQQGIVALMVASGSSGTSSGAAGATCDNYCSYGPHSSSCTGSDLVVDTSASGSVPSACYLTETITTDFSSAMTQPPQPAIGPTLSTSPANDVNTYNVKNALGLLTCPAVPEENPMDNSYFSNTASAISHMAGDACVASGPATLGTSAILTTNIHDGALSNIVQKQQVCNECGDHPVCYYVTLSDTVANAVVNNHLDMKNAASVSVNMLSYSPMLSGGLQNVVSSGFSTNTYIFKQIPLSAQHLIWKWSAEYADLTDNAKSDSQTFEVQNVITGYHYTSETFASPPCGEEDCPPDLYSYYCPVKYTLKITSTLTALQNVKIPFTEVTSPSGATTQFNSPIVPRFQLGFSMPAPYSQTMSRSYDVFSPFNYYTPRNSIEMYPVNTSDAFFVNYGGKLLWQPVSALNNPITLSTGLSVESSTDWTTMFTNFLKSVASFGSWVVGAAFGSTEFPTSGMMSPAVQNPLSISATATGYVFVLSRDTSNPLGGNYFLTILEPVPKGYYDAANYAPSMLETSDPTSFSNGWSGYWANIITMQSQNMYVINSIDLSAMINSAYPETAGQTISGFNLFNISADANGDVFIVGQPAWKILPYTILFEVTNTLSPSNIGVVASDLTNNNNNKPPVTTEIAASPTGGLVFTANPSSGYIYVFGGRLDYVNKVDISYAPMAGALNITDYLFKGGLLGVKFDGTAAPNVIGDGAYADQANDYDQASYHHPLALQDVNGYLYVLDDWSAGVGSKQCTLLLGHCIPLTGGAATNLNMLMIRVLNSTGTDLPINPTLFNDLWQQQTCSISNPPDTTTCYTRGTSPPASDCRPAGLCQWVQGPGCLTLSLVAQYTWSCNNVASQASNYYVLSSTAPTGTAHPPYGWILSASVQVSNNLNKPAVTFCSSGKCNFNPSNIQSAYPLAGPLLSASFYSRGDYPGLGFSINSNHTLSMLLRAPLDPCVFAGVCNPRFSELVSAQLNIENYTKLFAGGIPFTCYTDSQPDAKQNNPQSSCSQLDLSNMNGPTYTLTNPLSYLEGFGSASTSIPNFQVQLYSNLPSTASGQGTNLPGPPSLKIQAPKAKWGQLDQITATAQNVNDNVNVLVDGTSIAGGTGSVTYIICDVQADCLDPGSHEISAIETDPSTKLQVHGPTTTSLEIDAAPMLTMSSTIIDNSPAGGCTPQDIITATAPTADEEVTLSINEPDGSPLFSPPKSGTGSVSYKIEEGQTPICNLLSAGTYNVIAQTESGEQASQNLVVVSTAGQQAAPTVTPVPETLTSTMGGYVIVPYTYTYKVTEIWTNPQEDTQDEYTIHTPGCCAGTTCKPPEKEAGAVCPWSSTAVPPGGAGGTGSYTTSNIVYSYAIVDANSDTLQAMVEGGGTYLQNLPTSSLYIPNLSDAGAIIPPQLLYNIENNRLFGAIHVNDTLCSQGAGGSGSLDCSQNAQAVLNATQQLQYYVSTYTEGQAGAGWKMLGSTPYGPQYWTGLVQGGTPAVTAKGSGFGFSYNGIAQLGFVPLFEFYQGVAYVSPMYLYLNATSYQAGGTTMSTFGYHRIIYTFEDRFGNRIYAPMDVDIAYPVMLRLNVTPEVDINNPNSTAITINGIAGYYSNFGTTFTPAPAGQNIYLYYNKNLNFVNYNPLFDPVNAIYCAYDTPGKAGQLDCTQSNPIYTGRTQNAATTTFETSYNAMGVCNPPPNSLLVNNREPCNVYGTDAPITCSPTGQSAQQWCLPIFTNGTGFCTSQLGLMANVLTDSSGSFSYSTVACGNRQDTIIALYYGYPPPEPISVKQVPLDKASDAINNGGTLALMPSNEFNYYYAPNVTQTTFQIGLFELSYGNLGVFALCATIGTALLLLLIRMYRRPGHGPARRIASKRRRNTYL